MTISGACCLASAWAYGGPAWLLVAFGLVWGASVIADSAQFSTAVSELAPPAYVGTALSRSLGRRVAVVDADLLRPATMVERRRSFGTRSSSPRRTSAFRR